MAVVLWWGGFQCARYTTAWRRPDQGKQCGHRHDNAQESGQCLCHWPVGRAWSEELMLNARNRSAEIGGKEQLGDAAGNLLQFRRPLLGVARGQFLGQS